jgi:hypothetical protein
MSRSFVLDSHYLLRNLRSCNQESVPSHSYGKEIYLSQDIDAVKEDALESAKNRLEE